MKSKIRVEAYKENCNYEIPTNPKEFMEFWQDKISLIPDGFMDIAEIEVEAGFCYDHCAELNVTISYDRDETDEEETARLKREKERKEFQEQQELC